MPKGSIDDGVVFHAGFPNAAEDGKFGLLSLDALIVKHRVSTFFWRLEQAVPELQWNAGDIVVVDRSLTPGKTSYAVAVVDDEFVLVQMKQGRASRLDGSHVEQDSLLWGVVTHVIHVL